MAKTNRTKMALTPKLTENGALSEKYLWGSYDLHYGMNYSSLVL